MSASASERRRYAKTGRCAPRLPILPGPSSFPRKREPTGGRRAPTPVPSPAAFAASSPLVGEGGLGACGAANGGEIPAYAGMTGRVARPDSSTLSRRVCGVLSPYRERGNSGLAPMGIIRVRQESGRGAGAGRGAGRGEEREGGQGRVGRESALRPRPSGRRDDGIHMRAMRSGSRVRGNRHAGGVQDMHRQAS